jgi:hypothetical protein
LVEIKRWLWSEGVENVRSHIDFNERSHVEVKSKFLRKERIAIRYQV